MVVCGVPGKKSDLWWWWLCGWILEQSRASKAEGRLGRTCIELGRAGQGGPWSLADALQKRRRTVTGKLEQRLRARTENTEQTG